MIAARLESGGVAIKPREIMTGLIADWGIDCLYGKAWKAKELAEALVYGSPDDSFQQLPRYFHMLKERNPGTVTNIELNQNNQFKYCFWSFGPAIAGFPYTRPVIAIDATHLKGRFKGVMFVAVAKDANESVYPVGFGLGHKEDHDHWSWFLKNLRTAIGCPNDMVLISDQHKSIATACVNVYPKDEHGLCAVHIQRNLKNKFRREDISKMFFAARDAYKQSEMLYHMGLIKNVSQPAYDWLMSLAPNKWSRSLSPRRKYNVLTSNIVESFNNVIRNARRQPVTVLVECTRSVTQKWFAEKNQLAISSESILSTKANEYVNGVIELARFLQVKTVSLHEYQVLDHGKEELVDIENSTCTCMRFQSDLLPCKHATTVIM